MILIYFFIKLKIKIIIDFMTNLNFSKIYKILLIEIEHMFNKF